MVSRRREGRLLRRQRKREPRHLCREPHGSGLRRLTTDAAFAHEANVVRERTDHLRSRPAGAWSHDGAVLGAPGRDRRDPADGQRCRRRRTSSSPGRQTTSLWETAGGISKMNIDGSGVMSVFSGNGFNPDLSPTGTRIAFDANLFPFETTDIYMVNADGTGQYHGDEHRRPRSYESGLKPVGQRGADRRRSGRPGPGSRAIGPRRRSPRGAAFREQPQQIGSVTGNGPDWAWVPVEPPSGAAWGTSTGDGAKLRVCLPEEPLHLDV